MILLINICKEKLHYYEFVKPIEDILKKMKLSYFVKNYKEISDKDLKKAKKVIICGTSLKDFEYLNPYSFFNWIKEFEKPILGICGGMQIICALFGARLFERGKKTLDRKEIGMRIVHFEKTFLGLEGNQEVYLLHKMGVGVGKSRLGAFAFSDKGVQAIKHMEKDIYGVLFHPEVRQKDLIASFLNL